MSQLSPHFTYDELVYSNTAVKFHIANEPGPAELENLARLCEVLLEPARDLVGPLLVDSGYRCAELNKRVGGVPTSAHQEGRAADVVPTKVSLAVAFDLIRTSDLPYDQVIHEPTWIHIGIARPGTEPRRQALLAHPTDQGMVYERIS